MFGQREKDPGGGICELTGILKKGTACSSNRYQPGVKTHSHRGVPPPPKPLHAR